MGKLSIFASSVALLTCARPAPHDSATDLAVPGQVLARLDGAELPSGFSTEPLTTPGWYRVTYGGPANPLATARWLARLPGVVTAQPNWRYQAHAVPGDPFYGDQNAHQITDAETGWDVTTGSPNVVVAVLGSGIQLDHVELDDNLWTNAAESAGTSGVDDDNNDCIDDIHGCDYVDGDGDPNGGDHETRVAGVIAAEGDSADGGAGVMWTGAIMPVRIILSSDQVARAIDYAVGSGAHVINMSFGIYLPQVFGGDSIVDGALQRAEAANVVTVASAGNDSVMAASYPAAHPLVLGVGGTNDSDGRSSVSNAGWWLDCAAPGEGLVTTNNGGQIVQVSGTSFAAPYVAGLAGLLRAHQPSWSASQIREQILFSGEKIAPGRYLGYTRINVGNALTGVRPAPMARLRRPENGTVRGRGNLAVIGAAVGDSYELEWRASGGSWVSVANGAQVLDDVLGTIDTTASELGEYELRLTVSANSTTDSDQISFYLAPAYLDGWPRATFGPVASSPTFGDIDGDGVFELLVADTSNWVHGWRSDGTPLWFAPFWHPQQYPHAPALADIDGNGDVEIVTTARASGASGGVYAWQHDYRDDTIWSRSLDRVYGVPVVVDLDGNGDVEVILVEEADAASHVHVLDGSGTPVSGWPQSVSDGGRASPVVADFDGDGAFDILVSTETEEVLFDAGGSTHAGWPRDINGAFSEPVAADFDGDGDAELVSIQRTEVAIVDGDATVLSGWPQSIPDSGNNRAALGDLDGDGTPEIVLGLKNTEVRAWHADGTPVNGWPRSTGGEIWSAPAIADLDGDGAIDVTVTSRDGHVHAWSASGAVLADFPRPLHGPSSSSPAIGDFDGDGTLDLAVGGAELHWFLYAWDLGVPANPFTTEWSRARHDEVNTGAYPRRFPLSGTGTGSSADLSWSAPADVDTIASYAIYRDGALVTTVATTSYEDIPPENGTYEYGVVALGRAGTARARSLLVSVELDDVPPPPGGDDDGNTVRATCGCRTTGAPLVWLLALLLLRRR